VQGKGDGECTKRVLGEPIYSKVHVQKNMVPNKDPTCEVSCTSCMTWKTGQSRQQAIVALAGETRTICVSSAARF